jgi:glycosyltransferase involved in cell wall biosynthesis
MPTIAVDARAINSTTGRYVESLLRNLEVIDTENRYVVLVPAADVDYFRPRSPRFSVEVADFPSYTFAEQTAFLRLLNALGPDLVHFCMPQQPVLYRGRRVTTVHDLTLLKTRNSHHKRLVYEAKRSVGRAVFKTVGRTSAAIIAPSNYTRDEFVTFSGVDPAKVHVTYEGADRVTADLRPREELRDRPFLLYVGTQSDYKNVRRLVLAHQQLLETFPDLVLVLVGRLEGRGGASLRPNQAWVQEMGFRAVLFTGFVPDDELAWLYTQARAYVFPSLMEGFGLPGLEAMTYGTPLVSSNATCLPEVYGDGATYFEPTDVGSMTDAITRVLQDHGFADQLRQRGLARAATYSWRRMAEQTLDVYRTALAA